MDAYGLLPEAIKPPYTKLTAYDLNNGTIKWQIGLGDDYRVVNAGGPHGTGAAQLSQKIQPSSPAQGSSSLPLQIARSISTTRITGMNFSLCRRSELDWFPLDV